MAGFNFENNKLPTTPILIKKVDVSASATPTQKPYDFSAPAYFPQSFKFKKGNWASVYTEPTKPVPGSPQYAWANRTKAEELKSYEPSVAKKPVPYKLSPNPMDILAGGTAFGAQQKNTAMSTPATTSSEKSETNPFVAIGLSLASAAVDTAAKAVESIAAYISNQSNIKVGKNISGVMPTVPLSTLAPTKATREAVLKEENVYNQKSFDAFSGTDLGNPILTGAYKGIEGLRKPIVTQLNKSADLQNQPDWVQTGANVVGSIPYTLISRIPAGVGLLLNYGTSTMQAVEQKVAESGVPLSSLTPKQKLDIMDYATGSALVNAGSEQIFPAGKGAGMVIKAIAKTSFKNTVISAAKFLIKNGIQEEAEEGLSYIGTGLVAAITTDPVKTIWATKDSDPRTTLFGIESGSALINLKDLDTTMGMAFWSGVAFSGIAGGTAKASERYSNFKNTKAAYEAIKNVPLDEMTDEQVKNNFDALAADVAIPENAEIISEDAKIAIAKQEQALPVNVQISNLRNVLQELYSDDESTMSPEAIATRKVYINTINETIAELDSQQTVITSNGKKYSISQVEDYIVRYEDQVSFYTDALSKTVDPVLRESVQGDLDFAKEQVVKYSSLLKQSVPLTSAEMLANLQASRTPVNAQTTQNVQTPINTANVAQTVTSEAQSVSATNINQTATESVSINPVVAPKPTLEQAQKAYAESLKKTAPNIVFDKAYEQDVRKSGFTRKEADAEVLRASQEYKTVADVKAAVAKIQEELANNSVEAMIADGRIIKSKLQLFALKKVLSSFGETPVGRKLHSFIDSFREIAQKGSSKDIAKFINENLSVNQISYEQMSQKDELAKSDEFIAKYGDEGLSELFEEFSANPNMILNTDNGMSIGAKVISIHRYIEKLANSTDENLQLKGAAGLDALSDTLTRAGQMTNIIKVLLGRSKANVLVDSLKRYGTNKVDDADLKDVVDETKKIAGDFVGTKIEEAIDSVDASEFGASKEDSAAVDEVTKGKKEPADMATLISVLIKHDIIGKRNNVSSSDATIIVQMFHNVYLEDHPSEKGKATNIFKTLAMMTMNKERGGEAWENAKTKVKEAIAKENIKRAAAGQDALVVPKDYLDRLADPVFTRRAMDQAIRQVLNYMRTNMKAETRKFFLEGGNGQNTIDRFVTGLRDKFDDAYGQAMPDETFNYLKQHITERFTQSLKDSKDHISDLMREQAARTVEKNKNPINRKARLDKVIDQLADSVISGALKDEALSSIWAKRMGLNFISDAMREEIKTNIIKIDAITDENERFRAYQEFVGKLGNHIKATNIMKINAWRRFAMLCSPKTWTRNGASNYALIPYSKAMDAVEYRMQQALGVPQENRSRGKKYLKPGMNTEIDAIVDSHVTPAYVRTLVETSNKYALTEIGTQLRSEQKIFENDIVGGIANFPLEVISTGAFVKNGKFKIPFFGDQGILKVHLVNQFRQKLNALGYRESLTDSRKAEIILEAQTFAKEVAINRTYREVSVIAELLTRMKTNVNTDVQIKNLMDTKKPKDRAKARKRKQHLEMMNAVSEFCAPFIRTPAAIATEAYRFSPAAGLVSLGEYLNLRVGKKQTAKMSPVETAQITRQLSQALVGTLGQWTVGAILTFAGAMTGAPPDNDKEKKEWALEGKTAYSLYIPKVGWVSYAWCQPVAFGFMGGSDIMTVIKNGGYAPEAILPALGAGFNGVIGATLYGNLVDNLFGGRTATDNVNNFLSSSVTQFFPTLLKSFASTFDPYVRDTYSGNAAQVMLYRTLAYIPAASMLQPVKVDIWGNPVKNPDMGMGIVGRSVLNIISPMTKPEAQTDVVSKEVVRLFNATGSNSTLPVVVTAKWNKTLDATVDGVEGKYKFSYDLSGQDWVDFQTLMGQRAFSYAKQTIADERYIDATDADKVNYLTKAYAQASDDAKTEYITNHVKEGLGK